MRIQIIGVNFAPEPTGIAPYTAALARHLSTAHEVTVVTSLPHYPEWKVEPGKRPWRSECHDGAIRVIRLNHYIPNSPNVGSRALFEATFALRAWRAGLDRPADLVLTVVPALLGVHAARLVARRNNAPLGVVVQDVMGTAAAQTGLRGGRLVSKLTTRLEASALRSADSITTVHPRLAKEIEAICGQTPSVIYNWTHVRGRPRPGRSLRRELGWRDNETIVLHSGNMGAKQNLEVVIDAARLAERQGRSIHFVLAGAGSQRDRLTKYAGDCSQLSFLDSVADETYMDLLASSDVLLVNERPGMASMSLPSKLTSYLVAGRPIVASTDLHSPTAEFVRRSGGGVVCPAGSAQHLLDSVAGVAADSGLSRRLADTGRDFAEQHLSEDRALAAYDRWITKLARRSRTLHADRAHIAA